MRQSFKTAFVAVVIGCLVVQVAGHGWMMDPVPRSGGGAGSGNASTQSQCGKAGPTTPTAEYVIGQSVTVTYKRANSHGDPADSVDLTMSLPAGSKTNPGAADFNPANDGVFRVATGAHMDTTVSGGQSHTITVPDFNLTSDATVALQFVWRPTSGGAWYDCAYVTVRAPPANNPCNNANGGCHTNATCTPALTGGTRTCECRVGFVGDGITCDTAPDPMHLVLEVRSLNINQDSMTGNLAFVIGVPPSRILYDRDDELRSQGTSKIYFAITADSNGASPEADVIRFRDLFLSDDEKLDDLGVDVVSLQIMDGASNPEFQYVEGGQPIPGTQSPSDSSPSGGAIAGIVIGVIVGAAVLVALIVGALIFMKKRSGSGSLPAYYATNDTVKAEQAYSAPSAPSSSAPAPAPYARSTPAPPSRPAPTGARQWNRSAA